MTVSSIRLLLLVLILSVSSAAPPLPVQPQQATEIHRASWYGAEFDGQLTASGEIFDMNQLTAAHRDLPFGTLLRVTDVVNGRTVLVRVNDRGPFIAGRDLDLSYAAARKLGFDGQGLAPVEYEAVAD